MANSYRHYKDLVSVLHKHCPAAYPISVRRIVLGRGIEGKCFKHGRKFVIQIAKHLDEERAIDALLHEWAHARAWNHRLDTAPTDEMFNKLAHDPAWGVAYSEVYSIYEKNFAQSVL